MPNFPSFNESVAAQERNNFDLSENLVTTSNFGNLKPVYTRYCIAGDKFKIQASQFTRLLPMPSPTFGQIDLHTRGFFVPLRLLFRNFPDFISNKLRYDSSSKAYISNGSPTCTIGYFWHLFFNEEATSSGDIQAVIHKKYPDAVIPSSYLYTGYTVHPFTTFSSFDDYVKFDPSETTNYDVVSECPLYNSAGSLLGTAYLCCNLTTLGRRFVDLLHSLGYSTSFLKCMNFSWLNFKTHSSDEVRILSFAKSSVSLLPLFAYLRCFLDWYVPSRFIMPTYTQLQQLFEYNHASLTGQQTYEISFSMMYDNFISIIRNCLSSFYTDDYFTSAFSTPFGYEDDIHKDVALFQPSSSSSSLTIKGVGTDKSLGAVTNTGNSVNSAIDNFSILSLGAIQSLVTRGKLSGTKFRDWYKTTFGVFPPDGSLPQCKYIGHRQDSINIGDVMATAGTEKNSLGQYAGRGLGSSSCDFSYETNEPGFIMLLHDIQVKPSYPLGQYSHCDYTDVFDFFQPEFDNLGVDAIPNHRYMSETLKDDQWQSVNLNFNSVFGYTPRYSDFKVGFDRLSGDFRVSHLNSGLNSWWLGRTWTSINFANSSKSIDANFCLASSDAAQQTSFDQIFNIQNNSIDHFYEVWHFDVKASRLMKRLSNAFISDAERGNKSVDVNVND